MMNSLAIVLFLATFLFVFNLTTASPVEKYLLDSTQFQSELNWDKEAFGDSAELPGWKEQSFSQKNGDVWRVHFVCDISSSNPNNWLRLPFIQREQANRLIVKLEYTIRECKKYPGDIRSCKETFQLLYIESDNSTRPPDFSESNYRYLKTIAASNTDINQMSVQLTTQSTTASSIYRTEVELPLRTSKQGVYLVFRDQGACVSLLSVKVYYSLCSAQISNLIEFPETPTGSNATDLVQQTGKCIPNSDLMSNLQQQQQQQPFAYCQTNGNWFMVNDNQIMCSCRPGYYYSKSPQAQCIQCPQGKYKTEASNDQECLACPLYSYTKSNASRFCSCLDGFYRINSTDFSSGCIQYPDEPKNLTIYYLDQTSIKLRWNQIENTDVEYKLDCFKCSQKSSDKSHCKNKQPCESYIKYQPRKDNLTEPRIHLTSLDSNTQYLIELYAQSTRGLFKTKTVDILVRTYDDLLSLEIQNLTVYQFTEINQILLIWSDTNLPKLIGYELRYWPRDDPSKMNSILFKAPAHNFTLKNSNPNVINLNLYAFQLRAQSQNGWGVFTRPVESVPILYRNQNNPETTFNPTSSSYQIISSIISSTRTLGASEELNETQSNLTTIIMSTAISLSFFILILSLLIYFKRSNKLNCLNKNISKNTNNNSKNPITSSSSSSTHSDCDSLDFAKRAQAYNQLNSAGGTTSRSSGGSSPVWPPLNSFKTYIDPHTYEDPTRVVGLFAKELSPSNIIIESVIGGGEFGDVCKGCLRTTPWSESVVAIKTLKGAATEQNRCDFLTEASIMAQFKDPNVVRLEGVVTLSHPLMIVTEYMENGSLDSFLRLHENKLKINQMIKILRDVASGMRYLSDMNYIHRDLAARNILINRDLTCKVADFGLSRALDNDSLEYTTKGGKIPIRWTAPEACNFRKYSYASDVWSFGVLAYEVLSYGERPYWNWENTDVIKAIQESYRLPPPHITPDCLYKLMLRCWNDDRLLRPRFHDIVSFLDEIAHLPLELNSPTRIKELMPINPRQPTQIQLTSTKHFLQRIKLAHYTEVFHKNNLLNLANLFQLDAKDLAYQLNITNTYEQKIILDELKRISECFMNSISTQLNSYIMFHQQQQHHVNFNTLHKQQQQQQQHNTSSIFQLIRTGSVINTNNPSNSNNGADLLMVNSQQTNGFLV